MENKETILTDEQLDQVVETLKENRNETDKLIEQIEKEHENDDNSNAPLEEGEGQYISDGAIMGDVEESHAIDFDHFDNINTNFDKIVEENLKDTISQNYNFSDEDAMKFVSVISRVRAGEKFAIYNELPDPVKRQVLSMAKDENIPKNMMPQYLQAMSKIIIDELVHDTELDTMCIDLEKAMKELIPTPLEMYSETNRDYIENEFPKVAEKIKDTDPKKAENLLAMRQGFIDAYTFDPMYKVLDNNKVKKNLKRAEVVWSRVSNDYFAIASESKFHLYPLDEILKGLFELGFTKLQAYRLAELFVYTYTDGVKNLKNEEDYNDIYRNSFANYFENNIKNLAIAPDLISDFSKTVKENLFKLSDHIQSTIEARDAQLSNKNK